MKIGSFLATIAIVYSISLSAQKHDNIWLLGYPPNDSSRFLGGTKLDFSADNGPEVTFFQIPGSMGTSVTISDSLGHLLFYTNGCRIYNRLHQVMENGDSINPGRTFNIYCKDGEYPVTQSLLALPNPGKENYYHVFHNSHSPLNFIVNFLYTQIDMTENSGLGKTKNKNQIIFRDTFSDNLTATKHANGRDWWIVLPKNTWRRFTNLYYTFLFSSQGIMGPYVQAIGPEWEYRDWSGQSVFSPDGSRYARMNPFAGLFVYDFDRCTGQLSNPLHYTFPGDTLYSAGVAFSPNSRFLYASGTTKIYQFDMESSDILTSKTVVAEYDGFLDGVLGTRFFQAMLAPDGKIYMTSTNGVKYLLRIHQPDLPGIACDVRQHDLPLKTYAGWDIPNFPNYRLGALKGSPCDTLLSDVHSPAPDLKNHDIVVRPNPATDQTVVEITLPDYESGTAEIQIVDMLGRILHTYRFPKYAYLYQLDLSAWASGVYNITLWDKGLRRAKARLVVVW